eukprot:SM000126S26306  [mRNA]  locus=s126:163411:163857:+ [translate_table: standard]
MHPPGTGMHPKKGGMHPPGKGMHKATAAKAKPPPPVAKAQCSRTVYTGPMACQFPKPVCCNGHAPADDAATGASTGRLSRRARSTLVR